jgi:hypothetical protein
MPFKSIASPKKLSSLDGEIRAAAYLSNPGMVAMLSHSPERLGTFQLSGSAGKVTNVSIDGADGVALLSRDVALVLGEDHSVWALLDITHTPKLDQVGRDVRQLAFRPAGDTALALGWDDTATEFKISKHEVDARPFALRGTHRAIDIGETELYALVDGADGGQVRVHPGATPEPGASLRCNLPSPAAKLDHIRGGPRLIAVYKPGVASVCLCTGGPARLAAKMVVLEDRPTALGVIDTSLVATFSDGRAALYDSEAIAAASDGGPITPKSTTALGVRGTPETVLITSKGGATLWVGTSSGEVVSAALVRKQAIT